MARFSALLTMTLASFTAVAQDCSTGRYVNANLFADVDVTQGVVFGSNTGVSGSSQTLRMDVYEPSGDSEQLRPVVVVAFGGSFITGTRGDVAFICNDLAKRGYVAVANDYRVGFFLPNQTTTTRAVMRGAHDMRACVRYLRRSVAEMGNPYRIDTTRIIIGGVSAGAISALHAMYLDQDAEVPAVLASELPGLGGLEGSSGSPGYSSRAMACYSFSGALGDSAWIEPGDEPLVSLHEVGDNIVPYYTAPVFVGGIPTGLTASGSHDLHLRAGHIGITNCLKSYDANAHVGYLQSDQANALDYVAVFMGELVCGQSVTCGLSTSVAEVGKAQPLQCTPNPASTTTRLSLPSASDLSVNDMQGRVVERIRGCIGTVELDLTNLPAGAYTVRPSNPDLGAVRLLKAD